VIYDISVYAFTHVFFMVKAMSNWYCYRNGQQPGPMALTELKETMGRGYVDGDPLAWQPGMAEWAKSRKHPYLVSSILIPPPRPVPTRKAAGSLLKQFATSIFDPVCGVRSR